MYVRNLLDRGSLCTWGVVRIKGSGFLLVVLRYLAIARRIYFMEDN